MNDQSTALTVMLSFVAGGVAGASVALLLAPQSGRATRETMRRKLNDTASSGREVTDRLIRQGQRLRNEARHRVKDAVSALAGDGSVNRGDEAVSPLPGNGGVKLPG